MRTACLAWHSGCVKKLRDSDELLVRLRTPGPDPRPALAVLVAQGDAALVLPDLASYGMTPAELSLLGLAGIPDEFLQSYAEQWARAGDPEPFLTANCLPGTSALAAMSSVLDLDLAPGELVRLLRLLESESDRVAFRLLAANPSLTQHSIAEVVDLALEL